MRVSSSGRISKECFNKHKGWTEVLCSLVSPCSKCMSSGQIKLFSWSRTHWRLTFSQSPGRTKLLLAAIETHAMRWNAPRLSGLEESWLMQADTIHAASATVWVSIQLCVVLVPPPLFSLWEIARVEEGTISPTLQGMGVLQCGRTWVLAWLYHHHCFCVVSLTVFTTALAQTLPNNTQAREYLWETPGTILTYISSKSDPFQSH